MSNNYYCYLLCVYRYFRSWFTKAEELRQRQEKLVENRAQITKPTDLQQSTKQQTSSAESDDEELDFDSLLNWRAKVS